jgi:hypothetical protein
MAVAFFQAHFPRSFWPILNGGEPVVLFCFVYLYLVAAGAGPYSVDAALRARRLVSRRADNPDFSGVTAHGGSSRMGR